MVQKWQWKIYRMRANFDWKCCELFVVWNIVEKDKPFVKLSRVARNNNLRLIKKSSFLRTYVGKLKEALHLHRMSVCVWIAWQKIHTMHKCVMKWIDIDRMPNQCVIKLMCEIREIDLFGNLFCLFIAFSLSMRNGEGQNYELSQYLTLWT